MKNDFTSFENKSLNKKAQKQEAQRRWGIKAQSVKLFLYVSGLEKGTILEGQMECSCMKNTTILPMYRCVVP